MFIAEHGPSIPRPPVHPFPYTTRVTAGRAAAMRSGGFTDIGRTRTTTPWGYSSRGNKTTNLYVISTRRLKSEAPRYDCSHFSAQDGASCSVGAQVGDSFLPAAQTERTTLCSDRMRSERTTRHRRVNQGPCQLAQICSAADRSAPGVGGGRSGFRVAQHGTGLGHLGPVPAFRSALLLQIGAHNSAPRVSVPCQRLCSERHRRRSAWKRTTRHRRVNQGPCQLAQICSAADRSALGTGGPIRPEI